MTIKRMLVQPLQPQEHLAGCICTVFTDLSIRLLAVFLVRPQEPQVLLPRIFLGIFNYLVLGAPVGDELELICTSL